MQIGAVDEEQCYLLLLRATESIYRQIDNSTDYLHPALKPIATTPRAYQKKSVDEDPLNAWSHAASFEALSPTSTLLRGKSIVFKDNIAVGSLPTTVGTFAQLASATGEFLVSPIDASVVARVLEAGATVKGTATCESYSASILSFTSASGAVHNPWAYEFTAGGSSSGCGALLGARRVYNERQIDLQSRVDMAVGGDQGGSIRVPAAYNGVYGMKPTHGLVPYTGAASLSPMIDHLGPMAVELRDIACLLEAIAGFDGIDARMTPMSPLRSSVKSYTNILDKFTTKGLRAGEAKTLRVGLLREGFNVTGMTTQVRDVVYEAAKLYFTAAGASVQDVSIPLHLEGPLIWTAATRGSMADFVCANTPPGYLTYSPPHMKMQWPPTQEMYDLMTSHNPTIMNLVFSSQYLRNSACANIEAKAHRKVFELREAYDKALRTVDVLITPTVPSVAMPHPKLITENGHPASIMDKVQVAVGITANTCPFNVSGHPALSVPCGFGKYEGEPSAPTLPIGMQIIGRMWDEETVLKAAATFVHGKELRARL